ncbi:hypothetical protein [Antarctobacter jejuensis]|uniref:hypothetical protein n=1 Tax=Antarctobacter jejuensis TaxID=1439938 RepID=UPI003FD0C506
MRSKKRPADRVPVLAMVDAFVGGTAILLIFIVLSNNMLTTPGTQPQTDVTLRCLDRQAHFLPPAPPGLPQLPTDPLPPSEAAEWLARHPRPDRLLLRVRVEADTDELLCALRFQRAVRQMNDVTDTAQTREPGEERAILLMSMVPVATEPAE